VDAPPLACRWNLTANAARPNPQGSYHYGNITVTSTFKFSNSAPILFGRKRFAVNNVSHWNPDTPLKVADYYNIPNIFQVGSLPEHPTLAASMVDAPFRAFAEIVFQNDESTTQSWHVDGHNFWVVAFGTGLWKETARAGYNLHNAVPRSTTQVI